MAQNKYLNIAPVFDRYKTTDSNAAILWGDISEEPN